MPPKTNSAETVPFKSTPEAGRRRALNEVVSLSEEMLEDAQACRWSVLATKEMQRQRLIWDLFAEPLTSNEAQVFETKLKTILEISKQITLLGLADRERLSEELGKLRTGRQAHMAYEECARGKE